jgi:hypothetical protein
MIVELAGALNWTQTQGPWTIQFETDGEVPASRSGRGEMATPTPRKVPASEPSALICGMRIVRRGWVEETAVTG